MAYLESVIIRDTGGTEADVTAANALKVDGSAVTQPVSIVGGTVNATTDLQKDAFEQTVISNRYNQIEISYAKVDPDLITDITVTKTNGGDASNVAGQALFTSSANTNGGVIATTNLSVIYRPHAETYVAFSSIWTSGGLANSYQRIGLYNASNGFFIGYEGTVFGVTIRKGGVDTQTAQASFNVDTLTGSVGSKYTRNGVPEAANFALDNLFRIRFGWLGAAPIQWEIMSPDGEWVLFHIIRHPNTVALPSINDPDLPIQLEIKKTTAGATVLNMNTACWAAGTSSNFQKVTETINDNTLAALNRSVITGVTTGGGGGYVNVKVNPSGALVTAPDNNYSEDSAHASGDKGGFILAVRNDSNTAMTNANGDYSPIAVNANGAVAINDGGNSITVDGTVAFSNTSIQVTQATAANLNATVTGTVATGTEYAEDTTHSTGAKGNFILAVRNDTDSAVTSNDGDYSPISVNSKGAIAIQDGGNTITVDGTVNSNDVSADLTASISISALSGTSGSITTLNGQGTYVFQLTGTWTATLQVQITVDGTNWANITDSLAINSHTLGTFSANGNITANGIYQVDCSGLSGIRLIATAFSSGPVTGTARASKSDALTAIEGVATVTPQAITKGTQGAVGFTTQDLKDAGRTAVRYYAVAAAAGATGTETAITLTRSSGTSATSTAVSWTPTSGKTFRIQAISFATRGNATATIQTTTFNFRINTAGAVTTTSTPVILSMRSATPATASAWDRILLEIPDGIEIAGDGTLQFGITAAATYTTNAPTWDVTIVGYEY